MLELRTIRPMERRETERAPCRAAVRVWHLRGEEVDDHQPDAIDWFYLESTDISPEGVFLQTDLLFPVGEQLELEFEVPGRPRAVRGRGQVVRVEAEVGLGSGVAVCLSGLTSEERRALSRMSCELVRPAVGASRSSTAARG